MERTRKTLPSISLISPAGAAYGLNGGSAAGELGFQVRRAGHRGFSEGAEEPDETSSTGLNEKIYSMLSTGPGT